VAAVWICSGAIAQQPTLPCGGPEIARGTASHIIDGSTFVLDDGREVRLAGVEMPPLAHDSGAAPGWAAAKAALEALAGGDMVVLRRGEIPFDRYGRIVAYVYTQRDDDELFVQGELLAAGVARVGDRIGSRSCAAELLAREAGARRAQIGLWTDPNYAVLDAATPADVLSQRGRFALVEGMVVSVRESGSTIYINFGRRWSEGFFATVQKRNERSFAAAGLDVKSLAGRRVRIRGFVEAHSAAGSNPWIAAERPEQIEISGRD
jgi:endonuclease YncB( thermonuclease family)